MTENRSTAISGAHDLADDAARSGRANPPASYGPRARSFASRALIAGSSIVPTLGQVRAMA